MLTEWNLSGRIPVMTEERTKGNILERLVPVLLVASIGLAFAVGVLWQKVGNLEKTGVLGDIAQVQGDKEAQPQEPTQGKLPEEQVKNIPEVTSGDHINGRTDAQVFLVEYSDLECPFCSRFHATTKQVLEEYGDQVAIVYRHFPLDQLHQNARPAAIASECAAELGGEDAFWSFIDAIYSDQTRASALAEIATEIGLDEASLEQCLENNTFADKVEDSYQGGLAAGVRGTPGNFILNDKGEAWFIPGALPFETIKQVIDQALGKEG